jgi:hypothetical protein
MSENRPPQVRVYGDDGKLQQHPGQLNPAGRPLVTQAEHDGCVLRRVAPGRSLDLGGRHCAAGSLVRLMPGLSNDLLRAGVVEWPDAATDTPAQREPTVVEHGVPRTVIQGPTYR